MDSKKPWQSKTLWVNLALAIAAFFPGVQAIIKDNPELVAFVIAGVNGLLRVISSGKIALKDDSEPQK